MKMNYQEFLNKKQISVQPSGFEVNNFNPILFDFQKYAVHKALLAGRYALLEDCGLGKTYQQCEWANHVVRQTNKPAIILAPLGVTGQTIEQAKRLDLDIKKVGTGKSESKIYITNYEQLDNIDVSEFGAVVIDESSILKNFEGATKRKIIEGFRSVPYKLACTATPSPNDDMQPC
jgi:hypothetical protein